MTTAGTRYVARGRDGFEATLTTDHGSVLTVAGAIESVEPDVSGDDALRRNPALVNSLWAYGMHEALHRRMRARAVRESHAKESARRGAEARIIGRMVDQVGQRSREAWCSACFQRSEHVEVKGFSRPLKTYVCGTCGAPTARCAAPRCTNMANRRPRASAGPRYCAEHRHDIPSFAKLEQHFAGIDDYEQWLEYDKRNLARVTRVAGLSVIGGALLAPAALLAAPAIGGALGAMTGLSGAAATSHGLAMLGGGAIAAGGLGMAGGTAVITVVGAGLGSAMGGVTAAAYVRADSSFRIERLREGSGSVVLLANGFLTENSNDKWAGWRHLVDERYPDNPVYRVHWGAKELKAFGIMAGGALGKQAAKTAVLKLAGHANKKAAAGIPGLGFLLAGNELAANPWSVAKSRAAMTGTVLADLMARSNGQEFVLIGHSLGARVMVTAAQSLGTRGGAPKITAMHLLGAAVGAEGDWRTLIDAVDDRVYNYWSRNDFVLKYLYRTAQVGNRAAGQTGIRSRHRNISNRDVSAKVKTHADYFGGVRLVK